MNDQSVSAPDGTRIAYGVAGQGPALMLTNGLVTSTSFWKYLRPLWLRRFTLLTWDLPGHGASAPAASEQGACIEALPAIMARVMDAAGIERAVHVGWSVGSQIVLEMYRQYPARVQALITLFGPAGRALESTRLPVPARFIEYFINHPQAHLMARLLSWCVGLPLPSSVTQLLRRARLIGLQTSEKDLREILDHLTRLDLRTATWLAASCQRHSAYDVLPQIAVPLLIMAAGRDPFMPAEGVALPMHEAAAGSELVIIEGATHAALLDFPDEIAKHVDDFLCRRTGLAPDSSVRTADK
jgi:pimeloyl-ACP methyl ester carboxylesterase